MKGAIEIYYTTYITYFERSSQDRIVRVVSYFVLDCRRQLRILQYPIFLNSFNRRVELTIRVYVCMFV